MRFNTVSPNGATEASAAMEAARNDASSVVYDRHAMLT